MIKLRRLGWVILIVGVVWDLSYHTLLAVSSTALPPIVDVLGNLGHGITLGGIVLVILSFLIAQNKGNHR